MTQDERLFEDWWDAIGQHSLESRKLLAYSAYEFAMQGSRNYVGDDESEPEQITFRNGRIVTIGDNGYLTVSSLP